MLDFKFHIKGYGVSIQILCYDPRWDVDTKLRFVLSRKCAPWFGLAIRGSDYCEWVNGKPSHYQLVPINLLPFKQTR